MHHYGAYPGLLFLWFVLGFTIERIEINRAKIFDLKSNVTITKHLEAKL